MTYSEELAALKKQYRNEHAFEAVYAYLDLHTRTAEALAKSNPLEALEQYKLAEDRQSQVGSFATGSGEGLASMADLYKLMSQRAALEERIAKSAKSPAAALLHLESALAIWQEIAADPNKWYGALKPAPKLKHFEAEIKRVKETGNIK